MKKLMIIIHSLRGGGSERVLINLLKGLKSSDFSIQLILYEEVFDYPLPKNAEVVILNIKASRNIFMLAKGFISKIVNLSALIRKNRPDVIFSLLSSTNVAVILAKLFSGTGSTVIASEHTHPSVNLRNEIYGGITKLFMKFCYPRADRIVAVSRSIGRDLVRNFHIPEDKIAVIHNPVDIGEIALMSKEQVEHPWFHEPVPVIISVGRLTKQKGYPFLLRAFSRVRKCLPCRLAIIGEGEDGPKLNALATDLGMQGDVAFLGFQKNPFKYMSKSALFVLPSLYEGFPNVILEAMALGLPIVSTDCPSGPSEIIEDGKSGLLVPVGDDRALAGAIKEVMRDEPLRGSLGREARQGVRRFALDSIIEDYRRLFLANPSSPL